MSKSPEVSVVTTAYNAEAHIRSAIESVLQQRGVVLEHIIVDDGSTDRTPDVVRSIVDDRVRLITAGRVGRARALNLAIAAARADYVAILDADDVAHPERLAIELGVMRGRPGLAAVGSGQILLKGSEAPVWKPFRKRLETRNVIRDLLYYNPLSHSSVLLRRVALEQVIGYDERRSALFDWDLYVRLAEAGLMLEKLSTPLVAKRIHDRQFFEGDKRVRYALQCFNLQWRARIQLKRSRLSAPVFLVLFGYRLLSRPARTFVRRRLLDRQ